MDTVLMSLLTRILALTTLTHAGASYRAARLWIRDAPYTYGLFVVAGGTRRLGEGGGLFVARAAEREGWRRAPAYSLTAPPWPRPPRPPPRRDDDEKAAKVVDGLTAKVITGKKKLAALRTKMDEVDAKRAELAKQLERRRFV